MQICVLLHINWHKNILFVIERKLGNTLIIARVSNLCLDLNRYVVTGMRSTKEARIGDTLFHSRTIVEPLPGFLSHLGSNFLLFSGGIKF